MINQLTLEWKTEAGVRQTQTIQDPGQSKNPGTVRLGRDPTKCDLVFSHQSVSGLHVEIFFDRESNEFKLRNLRPSNPPLVDGKIFAQGEATLSLGSRIHLGQLQLEVIAVSVAEPEAQKTVLLSAPPAPANPQPTGPIKYGLQCPKCQRISPYSHLECGCSWCGTSLAAAASVVLGP